MVARHHDDLDSGATTLAHRIRHRGTGRVNHGHEADEAQSGDGEVGAFSVKLIARWVLLDGQVVVTETCNQDRESWQQSEPGIAKEK